MSRCADCRELLGGYVLGALERDDERAVREHLAVCATCAAEHERLAPLPALLDLSGSIEARAEQPDPSLEDAVLASYAAERAPRGARHGRRHRHAPKDVASRPRLPGWARGALAGALAGAALTAAVFALTGDGDRPREVQLVGSALAPDARATARLRGGPSGTNVELDVRGLAPTHGDEVYELWFSGDDGSMSAGTFRVPAAGRAKLRLAAGGFADRYPHLWVTREPDVRDPARNGPTVLNGWLDGWG